MKTCRRCSFPFINLLVYFLLRAVIYIIYEAHENCILFIIWTQACSSVINHKPQNARTPNAPNRSPELVCIVWLCTNSCFFFWCYVHYYKFLWHCYLWVLRLTKISNQTFAPKLLFLNLDFVSLEGKLKCWVVVNCWRTKNVSKCFFIPAHLLCFSIPWSFSFCSFKEREVELKSLRCVWIKPAHYDQTRSQRKVAVGVVGFYGWQRLWIFFP